MCVTWHIPCARHCAKWFVFIIWYNPPSPLRSVPFIHFAEKDPKAVGSYPQNWVSSL